MDVCIVLPSLIMIPVYSCFNFGNLGGNLNGKVCAANNVDFHPFAYQKDEELQKFLAQPNVINISE